MKTIYQTISACRICYANNIQTILDLGEQPPANSLYQANDPSPPAVPLRLMYCPQCATVQLGEDVDPKYLFSEYLWVTGTSATAQSYSRQFTQNALARCAKKTPYVIEIASNDGTFLKDFIHAGCQVLGIDPAKNIAEIATKNNIPTLAEFFNLELAQKLASQRGKSDMIFARNVIPHVKAIHSVIAGIQTLMADDGLGIIEFHDAGLIVKQLHYDSIYHEHLFYFSLQTLSSLLARYGLYVFDIMPSPISGGSWVIYFSKRKKAKTQALLKTQKTEETMGINTYARWLEFAKQVKLHAKALNQIIAQHDDKILAYGASARSATLLNFCGINAQRISAIIDKNPLKNGLLAPGSKIPIISYEQGIVDMANIQTICLLAWNFKDEIMYELTKLGFTGHFIIPLPNHPQVI